MSTHATYTHAHAQAQVALRHSGKMIYTGHHIRKIAEDMHDHEWKFTHFFY